MFRLFLLLVTFVAPLYADNLNLSFKLQVVTESLPPYQVANADKTISGSATDKVRQLLINLGFKVDIQMMPWARAYRIAATEANTLIYSIVRTPQREDKFNWLGVLFSKKVYLISLASRQDIRVKSITSTSLYTIGAIRDDFIVDYFVEAGLTKQLVELPDADAVFNMLLKGRVDLVPISKPQLESICIKIGCQTSDFRYVVEITDVSNDYYLAASKNTSPHIIRILKGGFVALNKGVK